MLTAGGGKRGGGQIDFRLFENPMKRRLHYVADHFGERCHTIPAVVWFYKWRKSPPVTVVLVELQRKSQTVAVALALVLRMSPPVAVVLAEL